MSALGQRRRERSGRSRAGGWLRAYAGLVALWLLAWGVYALYFQGQWVYGERPIYHITGDEPHYLVIATSLLRDHDLDVLNNYRDKDYFSFYPYHLGDARDLEDMHALYGRGGHVYSKHGLGLPFLLVPAMRLGGDGAAILTMMAVAAALSVQILLLAREVTGRRGASWLAWLAVSFCAPLLLYADQIYPEVPGALLTVVGVRAVLPARLSRANALRAGVAIGLLPWFHLRYVPLAAILAAAAALRFGRPILDALLPAPVADGPASHTSGRFGRLRAQLPAAPPERAVYAWTWLAWCAVPAALLGLGLLALDWRLFGGVPAVNEYGAVSPWHIPSGALGLLLDQQYGLLTYAPVFLVALYGLPLLQVPSRRLAAWTIVALLAVYFVFIASFSFWYGAFSPPSRMLVPVVPLLAVPLALALDRWRTWRLRAFTAALLLAGWSIAHLLMDVPRLRYNLADGQSQMLVYLSRVWGRDVAGLLPSFVVPAARAYLWSTVFAALACALWYGLTWPGIRWSPEVRRHIVRRHVARRPSTRATRAAMPQREPAAEHAPAPQSAPAPQP